MEKRRFCIARILRSHGLRGELKVDPIAPQWNDLDFNEPLRLVDRHGKETAARVETMRNQNRIVLVKFKEIDDRETAEKFAGGGIEIDETQLAELPDDEFYVKDIIGINVVDESGQKLGRVTQVLEMPASDVYEIEVAGEKKLIPAVAEFIRRVDIERREMTIRTIPGLLDHSEDVAS